jgi:vancomycin resistance protein YoaR
MARPTPPKRGAAPLAFGLIAGGCLAAIAALGAATFWSVYAAPSRTVSAGVSVADVEVGGLAREEVRELVRARLERYAGTPLTVSVPGGARRLTAAELGYRPELAATLAQIEALAVAPRREAMLAEWTGEARPRSIAPAFSIDDARLSAAAERLAAEVDQAPIDADVRMHADTRVEVVPSRPGRRLSRDELARRVQQAFRAMETEVAAPVEPVAAAISDADAGAAARQAEQFVAGPLEVVADGRAWTLSRGDLASWVTFVKSPQGAERVSFQLHPERPRNWLIDRASDLARPARDARLKLKGGRPTVASPEVPGLELDRAGSLAAIRAAATRPDRRAELPLRALAPAVTAAQAAQLAFPDLLAESATVYAGGTAERSHNVELAASRVDGAVVPPGASFSFNAALGRTRLRDGYRMAYGIQSGDDGVQTVPSVAGGICQVATTLFHATFWSGLQIEERHEHPYWIPKYGLPPRGLTGLDTTVDEDSRLDFRFKNTTGAPILVQASTDGSQVVFQLLGTRTGWEVRATGPSLSKFVKADPTFVRQEDPTLAVGRALQVEEARDGFEAVVARTVSKGGRVIDELKVESRYAPSRNVVLVGTRR